MSLLRFGESRLQAHALAGSEAGWLYHGTDNSSLRQIISDGLYPGAVAPDDEDIFDETFGSPADPDTGRAASYWTTNPRFAEQFGRNILRTRKPPRAVEVRPSATYDEWLVPHVVRARDLDLRIGPGGEDGDEDFIPLLDAVKQGLVLR